jgi:hypothetical protein
MQVVCFGTGTVNSFVLVVNNSNEVRDPYMTSCRRHGMQVMYEQHTAAAGAWCWC